ncbi:MAG TPA: alpha-glucuronidase family glycosyl hydrolase [Bryobacteraceae bacterium]|nr:alpha-glucuronidase family glycosyl hydrolase [Bryobacteraceae bacterium]
MRWASIRNVAGWALVACATARAESGYDAWLRYPPLQTPAAQVITVVGISPLLESARQELARGLRMPGVEIVLRTSASLKSDGYSLKTAGGKVVITGPNDRGVLYGAFALLRKVALGESLTKLDETSEPRVPVRWVNHWDNLDGSIERGYGGRSIFWDNGRSRPDLTRVRDYGRMLASLGINGASINNVNVNPRILAADFLPEIVRIADTLRPWGVRTVLSVDFGSPQKVGGLDTFDPLDPNVIAWWKVKADEIYRAIPDLGGFIIKADSEGRVGPSAYGRTHADAANVVARALKPHGGLIFYRGFVYDNKMDWRNPKNDRARAADDNFRALDGKFDDNVVIQIKNGPIDFQVREPASPLFGTLQNTKQAIELQITQEYVGQARHTVFLPPMWKETLDFDLRVKNRVSPVKSRVNAVVGVSNVGLDDNWLGNHLSQANLYGFGRLAWNPDLSARQIAEEWTRLTFGNDPKVVQTIAELQLTSWRTYENYTGPLGLQTLTDIVGNHYGVAVEASERNGWGQWHRADTEGDARGVGMDRTVATGTGYIGQYATAVARMYESLATCPDDLLLFMHHVPYTHVLHSGKTVIQYLYDSHYEGAEAVEDYVRDWTSLRGRVDDRRYQEVLAQLVYQAGQAEVWRDAVSNWFLRASGIPDAKGRVGRYPNRMEAESSKLDGYKVIDVTPWEAASGGKAVECVSGRCSATFVYGGAAGVHQIRIRYFDQNNGIARFRALIGDRVLGEWAAADRVPTPKIDSSSSALHAIEPVALRPGDEIRIEGLPDGGETAALDYIEIR